MRYLLMRAGPRQGPAFLQNWLQTCAWFKFNPPPALTLLHLFFQNSATINCLNSLHQTPLAVAAAYNHVEVIEFLLKCGAQIETQDKNGYTPLLLAASEGNAEAVRVLLQSGANIFCMDKEDRTVLYWASMQNHKNVVDVRKKLLPCYSWSWLNERTKKILLSPYVGWVVIWVC